MPFDKTSYWKGRLSFQTSFWQIYIKSGTSTITIVIMAYNKERRQKGLHLHRVRPILLGGSPSDEKNIQFVTRQQHAELVVFWNNKVKEIKKQ